MLVVDVGYRSLIVVDLDMLLKLAVFVPFFDIDDILRNLRVSKGSKRKWEIPPSSSSSIGFYLFHRPSRGERGRGGIVAFTPRTEPSCTKPGSFRTRPFASLPARRRHILRALGSVAISIALKGTRLARRIVSRRDVAVTMWDDPAVRDV